MVAAWNGVVCQLQFASIRLDYQNHCIWMSNSGVMHLWGVTPLSCAVWCPMCVLSDVWCVCCSSAGCETSLYRLSYALSYVLGLVSAYNYCDLHKVKLTQKLDLLEWKYFTGSMPFLTPKHCFKTCSGLETLTSITIFKECGVKTSSGRQEHSII